LAENLCCNDADAGGLDAISWRIDRLGTRKTSLDLTEPLALIELALHSPEVARERFSNYRLTSLVASRLELDDADIARLSVIRRTSVVCPSGAATSTSRQPSSAKWTAPSAIQFVLPARSRTSTRRNPGLPLPV
jgi:hypothetical protein